MNRVRFFLALGLIFLGAMSRFLPHPPNFTAMNTIALLGTSFLGGWSFALLVVWIAMLLCDLVQGFHATLLFVYGSFGLVVWLGRWVQFKKRVCIPILLSASSLLFFILTNLGVWMMTSYYPKTSLGLMQCYMAALPFLANQMIGDLFYGLMLSMLFSSWLGHREGEKIPLEPHGL